MLFDFIFTFSFIHFLAGGAMFMSTYGMLL